MSITTSAVIGKVRTILNDAAGARWPDAELLSWINEARRAMFGVKPSIFGNGTYVEHALTAGNRQRITTDRAQGIASIDSNKNGAAVRPTTRAQFDAFRPLWQTDVGDAIQNWFPDQSDPLAFWVYPAPSTAAISAGAKLTAHVWVMPTDLSNASSTTEIAVPYDQYESALVNFVLARAYAKEDEAAAQERALAYLDLFNKALA